MTPRIRHGLLAVLISFCFACTGELSGDSGDGGTFSFTPNDAGASTSAICGDGVVEGSEKCDGSCPMACDDGNTCTADNLTGSNANCDAVCSHALIVMCIDADGCCPDGCDATSDSDCSDSCGDGVVDPDETCDGNCPTACDDGDACTTSELTGSAATCNVQCSTTPITACDDETADGCCPPGCTANTDADCGAECGNDVVEGTEACDGDCPSDCDDGEACTTDVLSGAAATCDAVCENTDIVQCIDGDGCCPSTCNQVNDDDCPAECGNGVVEDGETCDGSCPSDCDDGVACTADQMSGSAATCDVMCAHTDIVQCVGGDGCCPDACDETNDDDCAAVCDNGVLESGETCDPVADCPVEADCDDSIACTEDRLIGSAQTCDALCRNTDIVLCVDADGCCPAGCDETEDLDCTPVCGNGVQETGETCDPVGTCPASDADCDDGDACTGDTLTGDPADCTAECVYNDVTACIGGDGCCPTGCDPTNDTDCDAVCDNGNVEPGETCDPIASCPTGAADCDDGEACTTDAVSGDPNACTAECTHTDVTMCVDGDGCCPSGCDQTEDDDCSSVCDNGTVETGETCDPIASCPSDVGDCDDGDVCTEDSFSGDPASCTATCANETITTCTDGDGCCPSMCDSSNDDDCPTVIDCTDPATWPTGWTQLEDAIFAETNARRTQPQTCGNASYGAAPALIFDERLREAARCHAMDMIDNDFFDHVGSGGSSPGDRITAAGYTWSTYRENIATGNSTAEEILDQWMGSAGHCENIMRADVEELGVAYVYDGTQQWYHFQVQVFATGN